jgi:hypothetical protein
MRFKLRAAPRAVAESYGGNRAVPLIGLFMVAGRLIESAIKGRSAVVDACLCPVHQRRYFVKRLIWWVVLVGAIALFWFGLEGKHAAAFLLGGLASLVMIASPEEYPRVLRAVAVDEENVFAVGAGVPYRRSLPYYQPKK